MDAANILTPYRVLGTLLGVKLGEQRSQKKLFKNMTRRIPKRFQSTYYRYADQLYFCVCRVNFGPIVAILIVSLMRHTQELVNCI